MAIREARELPEAADTSPILPVIAVLGGYSSGTTAVAGYLARLGAYSCPPHSITNDPRTPDSYESAELRSQCLKVINEQTLSKAGDDEGFCRWLAPWLGEQSRLARREGCTHLLIKHALLALLAPQIDKVCSPQFVLVTRPLDQIERTRLRRKWHATFGQAGARVIYSAAFSNLTDMERGYHTVAFGEFLRSATTRRALASNLGLDPQAGQIEAADGWLR